MVDEFASMPLEIRDVMLFDDEVAPVRVSAGKDNPRARISGENFVVCCTQNRDIRLWLHHHNSMILRAARCERTGCTTSSRTLKPPAKRPCVPIKTRASARPAMLSPITIARCSGKRNGPISGFSFALLRQFQPSASHLCYQSLVLDDGRGSMVFTKP